VTCAEIPIINLKGDEMKFQVVSVTPKAGISKGTQKPYSMLVVDGVFTGADGVISTAELVFFAENGRPAPVVQPGMSYEPIIKVIVNRDKKLVAVVDSLRPIAVVKAAA
jgi:hypothetical protein